MGKSFKKKQWAQERVSKENTEWAAKHVKKIKEDFKKKKALRTRNVSGSDVLKRIRHLDLIRDYWIRDVDDWKCKSYNPDRQEKDLIKFLLCKYPVPSFLLNLFYKPNLNGLDHDMLLLLCDMGTGNSPRNTLKKYLSKKEMVYFYDGKYDDYISNMWYARCKNKNLSESLINSFISKNKRTLQNIQSPEHASFDFWNHVIMFFSKYQNDIVPVDVIDLSDYFQHIQYDNNFSLKGRTLNSVIRLSNEWHDNLSKIKNRPKQIISWKGMNIPDWKKEIKNKDKNTFFTWNIVQITNNIDLHKEGKEQNHCVYSYVYKCENNSSAIFTMYESLNVKSKITIEVNPSSKSIVQTRGKRNRNPNNEEQNVISKWANDNNLKIEKNSWRW